MRWDPACPRGCLCSHYSIEDTTCPTTAKSSTQYDQICTIILHRVSSRFQSSSRRLAFFRRFQPTPVTRRPRSSTAAALILTFRHPPRHYRSSRPSRHPTILILSLTSLSHMLRTTRTHIRRHGSLLVILALLALSLNRFIRWLHYSTRSPTIGFAGWKILRHEFLEIKVFASRSSSTVSVTALRTL